MKTTDKCRYHELKNSLAQSELTVWNEIGTPQTARSLLTYSCDCTKMETKDKTNITVEVTWKPNTSQFPFEEILPFY